MPFRGLTPKSALPEFRMVLAIKEQGYENSICLCGFNPNDRLCTSTHSMRFEVNYVGLPKNGNPIYFTYHVI
jgi:hypothetical protein